MTIEIRPQSAVDADAVRSVVGGAFGDPAIADLVEALRRRCDTQADLVAVDEGAVVGHTHLSVSWVDAPTRLVPVLVLSPLSVRPDRQRQGVGRELLGAARTAAGDLGSPLLFLEGDPTYYARHGWRPAVELGFVAPSRRIPDAAFRVVTLAGYDPGVMTGALVYNDTFWTFDAVGLRDPSGG